ncbi:hypothetical protein PISMIDRAFT_94920, partial [Pisolithus microcarpus 441]
SQNQPEGGLVNGSLGMVIEFITVREARDQFLSIADMSKRETSVNQLTTNTIHGFGKDNVFPLVKFTNEKLLLCAPTDFTVENIKGGVEARRIQIPLALSYAMSIHKSQGQTLSRVRVDLGRIFEKGQGTHVNRLNWPKLTSVIFQLTLLCPEQRAWKALKF